MSTSKIPVFTKTFIAVSVLTLSACSTTPPVADFELKQIGATIVTASRNTADLSKRTWDRTSYLLGFSDGTSTNPDGSLMDEVDLALLEEDAPAADDTTVRPIIIQQATATRLDDSEGSSLPQPAIIIVDNEAPADELLGNAESVEDVLAGAQSPTPAEDLIHEVSANETLWDIAKQTTGDANNWHSIADLNNLAPNAAVFPGQQIIIPSDLVKTDFNLAEGTAQEPTLAGAEAVAELDGNELSDAELTLAGDVSQNSEAFDLKAGETLWELAKRTTGDALNWKAIAAQNNFTEKQAVVVHEGQTIYVPNELVMPDTVASADSADDVQLDTQPLADTSELPAEPTVSVEVASVASEETLKRIALDQNIAPQDVAAPVADETAEAVSTVGELMADASDLNVEEQPIKIVEAAFKSDETMQTMELETEPAAATPVVNAEAPEKIMVSGTYYPKAVYNDADFSSSLLMRVSPGTTLQVSRAMGSWFEVETHKGRGFVHQRDIK